MGVTTPCTLVAQRMKRNMAPFTPEDADKNSNAVAFQCFALQSALTHYNYSSRNISGCGIIMQFTFIICKSDNSIVETQPKLCLQSCTMQLECSSIVDSQCHSNLPGFSQAMGIQIVVKLISP